MSLLRSTPTARRTKPIRRSSRLALVAELMLEGRSTFEEIARKHGTTIGNVSMHAQHLRRKHGFEYEVDGPGGRVRLIVPKGAKLWAD